jgi:hypothetical protein
MTKIINLLQQLSELDPATCRRHPDVAVYTIDGYSFWLADDGLFSASIPDCRYVFTGRPALAWLRDAVEAAIEARGWYWEMDSFKTNKGVRYQSRIAKAYRKYQVASTPAEALLAAFVEATRAEKAAR